MEYSYIIGICFAIAILLFLTIKNVDIILTAFICSCVVAFTNHMDLYDSIASVYMTGFSDFFKNYFLIFVSSAIFGKLMEITGGAQAIASFIARFTGKEQAFYAIPIILGIMSYGGINGYVAHFAVYSIGVQLFREADIPRRLLPGWMLFGTGTFSNAAPGAPSFLNIITTTSMEVPLSAGALVGLLSNLLVFIVGYFWYSCIIKKAKKNGEHFIPREQDSNLKLSDKMPNSILAIFPLIITIAVLNIPFNKGSNISVEVGVLIGCISVCVLMHKFISFNKLVEQLQIAIHNGLNVVIATGAIVAFGNVMSETPAFHIMTKFMLNLAGIPAISLCVATAVLAFMAGSGTAGVSIAAPILGPYYVKSGLAPELVVRLMTASAITLDSTPWCGGIYAIMVGLCGETVKDAYPTVCKLCMITPMVGMIFTIVFSFILG